MSAIVGKFVDHNSVESGKSKFVDIESVESSAERDWQTLGSVREEFAGNKAAYIAFRKAEANGSARVYRARRAVYEHNPAAARQGHKGK